MDVQTRISLCFMEEGICPIVALALRLTYFR